MRPAHRPARRMPSLVTGLSAAIALLAGLGLPTPAVASATTPTAPLRVLQAERVLLDPAEGRIGPATLVIEGERILQVLAGADAALPAELQARVLDQRRFDASTVLMPGLIDSHVHLTGNPAEPFWQDRKSVV